MEQKSKVGHYDFFTEAFHVDLKGRLFLGILGNQLLNVAGMHAKDRGFGIAYLNENHYTWVLSRLVVDMEKMPLQYESYSIETWVENVYKLFTDRNFSIIGEGGDVLGYARSVWAMIDMESRKPADLLALHGGNITEYIETSRECPIDKPSRIKVSSAEPVSTQEMHYCDIDINGHVNSIKYIEHILDLFSIERYKKERVRRFEIAYVAESYCGDKLSFFCDEVSASEYNVEVRKNVEADSKGEVVVRAKVVFAK